MSHNLIDMMDFAQVAVLALVSVSLGAIVAVVVFRTRTTQPVAALESDKVLGAISQFADSYGTAGLIADVDGNVIHSSKTAEALSLVRRKKVVPEIMRAAIEHTGRTGEGAAAELDLNSGRSGDPGTAVIHSVPLGRDLVLVLVDDTTESRRLEEMRRDFVANISHELKTPIGAITLLAEALRDGIDDAETVAKFSRNIHKESLRLARIVSDIIQLSRVQAREILREAQAIRLDTVIADAIDQTSVISETKRIRLKVNQPDNVVVLGDAGLLTIAIKNLIENAIQFSDDASVVRVTVKASKRFVEIVVSDEGIGISPDDQSRVFERFYRVDASRSRKTGGTGLGLSIVKHIVIAHRGEIGVSSELETGSAFTITLPRLTPNRKATRS